MVTTAEARFLNSVSKRIAEKRKAIGYSQLRLAKESGLTERHIGHIEQGRRRPTLLTLYRLARGLDVDVSELLKEL